MAARAATDGRLASDGAVALHPLQLPAHPRERGEGAHVEEGVPIHHLDAHAQSRVHTTHDQIGKFERAIAAKEGQRLGAHDAYPCVEKLVYLATGPESAKASVFGDLDGACGNHAAVTVSHERHGIAMLGMPPISRGVVGVHEHVAGGQDERRLDCPTQRAQPRRRPPQAAVVDAANLAAEARCFEVLSDLACPVAGSRNRGSRSAP